MKPIPGFLLGHSDHHHWFSTVWLLPSKLASHRGFQGTWTQNLSFQRPILYLVSYKGNAYKSSQWLYHSLGSVTIALVDLTDWWIFQITLYRKMSNYFPQGRTVSMKLGLCFTVNGSIKKLEIPLKLNVKAFLQYDTKTIKQFYWYMQSCLSL